jgi:uncharacterized protein
MSSSIDPQIHKKYTLSITQNCNLDCDYCYIKKKNSVMPLSIARRTVDYIFKNAEKSDKIDINLFGGEPLLEFDLIKKIVDIIHAQSSFDHKRVVISVVTNGTIFNEDIADFLIEKNVILCISCDGPQKVQDKFRHFPDGRGSSAIVEKNIRHILDIFPLTPINAVYSPENVQLLPQVVDYLAFLGVKNIHLSPNISAKWTKTEAEMLPKIYDAVAGRYIDFYINNVPRYISFIDSKIAVILRGGYRPLERCRMGEEEFAFAPSGNIYGCERLIGSDDGKEHCLGNISDGIVSVKTREGACNAAINKECMECSLSDYCMNWCGCTNYHSTGYYNIVSPFVCASERATINAAFNIIQAMNNLGLDFSHHISGTPLMNVVAENMKECDRY